MEAERVRLGPRSYDICVGSGAIREIGRRLPPGAAFVIADERLTAARAALIRSLARAGWSVEEIAVRAGERLKDFRSVYPIYGELLERKADRGATLFALGGGSVGDAAGFIAATYLRGIRWVGVPTTLLAQVDSSVGGKTGINHEVGKNLIGAFHQPSLVVCDSDFLATLSARETVSGMGEIVKIAVALDKTLLVFLKDHPGHHLGRHHLSRAIRTALAWKAKLVSRDECDRTGVREVLNFGHTFGHALEAETRFRRYRHGEAVLWGMRFAIALSEIRGKLAPRTGAGLDDFLASFEVPALPRGLRQAAIFTHMKNDKKVREGRVRFVLLSREGRAVLDHDVGSRDLSRAFALLMDRANG